MSRGLPGRPERRANGEGAGAPGGSRPDVMAAGQPPPPPPLLLLPEPEPEPRRAEGSAATSPQGSGWRAGGRSMGRAALGRLQLLLQLLVVWPSPGRPAGEWRAGRGREGPGAVRRARVLKGPPAGPPGPAGRFGESCGARELSCLAVLKQAWPEESRGGRAGDREGEGGRGHPSCLSLVRSARVEEAPQRARPANRRPL